MSFLCVVCNCSKNKKKDALVNVYTVESHKKKKKTNVS